jgi:prophage regulatory protein
MNEQVQPMRFYRLKEIIGDRKAGIPAIIPVCRTVWYAGIKKGVYPKPVRLSERTTAWKSTDIEKLAKQLSGEVDAPGQ